MRVDLKDGRHVNVTIQVNEKGTYEYSISGILVGVYTPNIMADQKFLEIDLEKNNTLANELSAESKDNIKQIIEEVADQINATKTEKLEEEARENMAIDHYLQERGIDRKNVKITFMDLEKEETREKNGDKPSQTKYTSEVAQEEMTTSDVNVKQEINLSERATDVEDFRKWLGGNLPKDSKKIGVIDSNEMSQMKDENEKVIDNSSTQLGLIVISKDNKVEPLKKYIPQLEQNHSSGNNPMGSQYQIHTDGTVEKDPVLSEYRIGRKIIQLDKDDGDDLEVNIGKYSPHRNELVTTRMRDRNTPFATDTQTRKAAMGHYKGVNESRNSYQEAQEHEKAGCEPEKLTREEIDGEKDTGHQHFTEEEFEKCIEELMQNEEISQVFTEKEIRERLTEKIASNSEFSDDEFDEEKAKAKVKSIEEIKEETEAELEEDAVHFERN